MQNQEEKVSSHKLNSKQIPKPELCKFSELFQFSTKGEKIIMILGCIAASCNGLCMPAFCFIQGQTIDKFTSYRTTSSLVDSAATQAIQFAVLGTISFIFSVIQQSIWINFGETIGLRFRKIYFRTLVNQDIGWFDTINPNTLATKVAQESLSVSNAVGEKVPQFLQTLFTCVGGYLVAYVRGWEMSIVLTAVLPLLILLGFLMAFFQQNITKIQQKLYADAGGLAEQAVTHVKTVKSLVGEDYEMKRYSIGLIRGHLVGVRVGVYVALSFACLMLMMSLNYALTFYYGSILLKNKKNNSFYDRVYTLGDVMTVYYGIFMSGLNIGQIAPCLKSFAEGKAAGYNMLKVIYKKPTIKQDDSKQSFNGIKQSIKFNDVVFNYPSKPDIKVLQKISITFEAHKKTALVGESGSGKSTIVQLIERFYDPIEGNISIDSTTIPDFQLQSLRKGIAYVGQEPVLFAGTISDNLKLAKENATDQEMINCLQQANAWEFVEKLEKKLETYVGTGGSQLSGGQKQRICIARAILKDPKILLLDEATSALDRKNEQEIQKTLDQISIGRTTIVVAHRLSTIQNADKIIVLDTGTFIEEGTHTQLMEKKGKYYELNKNQVYAESDDENENSDQNLNNGELVADERQYSIKKQSMRKVSTKNSKLKDSQLKSKIKLGPKDGKPDQLALKAEQEQEKLYQQQRKLKEKGIFARLLTYNRPELRWLILACLSAAGQGVTFPIIALPYSKMILIFPRKIRDENWEHDVNKYVLVYVYIAIASFITVFCQIIFFIIVGEGLTLRIRRDCFAKMLRMPGSWFDVPRNNPGALASRLSSDAYIVHYNTTTIFGQTLYCFAAFATGIILAFFGSWRLSLVSLAIAPFIFFSGFIRMRASKGFNQRTDDNYKDAGQLIMETVTNIRTVASFGSENMLQKQFHNKLVAVEKMVVNMSIKSAIAYGCSFLFMYGKNAIVYYVGALFVRDYGLQVSDLYLSYMAILYAAGSAGNASQSMGDIGKAKNAAINLFEILDAQDEIQIQEQRKSKKLKPATIKGDIEFRNVKFKYPSRDAIIFSNLSFKVQAGKKVAFCGPSGCGKSTILQLLQRHYDIDNGEITLDGINIQEYDINALRSYFGVVNQEPILFNGTIAENIEYNTPDMNMDRVRQAAEQSNSLKFIENNEFDIIMCDQNDQQKQENGGKNVPSSQNTNQPHSCGTGFQMQVGIKGQQISGGQKQRIAIARAIIKNPQILLLDEATSALDTENERIVQQSLDKIMQNKTSLCIAHRISTIKDSDKIFVINHGELIEQGNYQELVNMKGLFYELERGGYNQ